MKTLTKIFQALLGVGSLIFTALAAAGRLAWRTIRGWWKNRPKWFRIMTRSVLALLLVCFAVMFGYALYSVTYGRDYGTDKRLSENVVMYKYADGKWKVYNEQTRKFTTGRISWASVSDEDTLTVYALSDKRGYINVNTGLVAIDAKKNGYSKAWMFSDGLAAVMKDGKIGFINHRNELVIPFRFDYTDKCRMYGFAYVFHDGYCAMTNADGDLGLIDKAGNWVVEPEYDEIWIPGEKGYRVIVKDAKHGVLDANGNVVYPAEYLYLSVKSDGFILTRGGRQWQVDFEGNVVRPFMFDDSSYMSYPIDYIESEGYVHALSDYMQYEVLGSYGIVNRITGECLTPAIYSRINMISNRLFEVQEYDKYEWYLLDTNGNVVPR